MTRSSRTQAGWLGTALLLVAFAMTFAACGYTLEGADRSRAIVRLEVPAVASTEPDATSWLRATLRRELAARGVVVQQDARRTLVVEVLRVSRDDDLAEVRGETVLSGRSGVTVEGLARLRSAGQDWSMRAYGRADVPAASAPRMRALRAMLVRSALSDLARVIADRVQDRPPDGP